MRKDNVILFGAGKLAKRYIKILTELGITILFLADNNQYRWGGSYCGIRIGTPLELYTSSARIVIAANDRGAITHQLVQMGLQDRIGSFIEIVCNNSRNYLERCIKKLGFHMPDGRENTLIIDNLNGKWGGAESWVHIVGDGLKSRGLPVLIIGNSEADRQFDEDKTVCRFDTENLESLALLSQIIKKMYELLPITFIDISSGYVLWAACILKCQFPNRVKIITAVLNDIASAHEKQLDGQKYIDSYFCISTKLRDTFCNQYGVSPNRVFFKEPFADYEADFIKKYNLEESIPIQIGYACRLCKAQKRADMLPAFIEKLEENKLNYQINIAGDGECQDEIKAYIGQRRLTHKVKMYGLLKKAQMPEYWKQQDIYLNFSEFEGTSLTMLDAMSYGVVPVVTDVSGVNDFIDNGRNGLIYPIGDFDGIVNGIIHLNKNRNLLQEYGTICRERIYKRCSLHTYIDFIEAMLDREG